jgi:hypothetical protein
VGQGVHRWGGESILGVEVVGDSPRKALHGGCASSGGERPWEARLVVSGGGRQVGEERGAQAELGEVAI